MDVIEAINGLMLDTLDSEYIESVWSQEFMGNAELPDEYKEHCDRVGIEILSKIITAVECWQAENHSSISPDIGDIEEGEDRSWKQLTEMKLDYKALLSVLWSFITNGQRNKCNEASRLLSLKAAILYLKLLAVSGSRVYNAFHPYLCLKAVMVLKFGTLIISKQNKKSKKRSGEVTTYDVFANDMGEIQLSVKQTAFLINELILVIHALQLFVTKFSLESHQELLEEIIERLAEITRLEVNTSILMTYSVFNRSNVDVCVSHLAYNAYECLKMLCSPHHGDVEDIVIIVMKHLLSSVLLADHDLSFREQCTIRDHAANFIKYMLSSLKEVTHRGITILIHHVFTRIGEKAEARQKGKETIVNIMRIMSYRQYTQLVRWLFDCAHSDKASYRLLAVEVISQLLYEDSHIQPSASIDSDSDSYIVDGSTTNGNTEPERPSCFSTMEGVMLHKYMLAVIFARCRDSSGIVRAKALSLLVQCMKTDNMVVCSLMNEIFVLNQQQYNTDEKDILNYKQIIAALKKKSNMNPLPGAAVIIDEFKSLACDSKVNVRKAALQALESVIKLNRSWLTESILKMLGTSCRDPAVSVRKEMVQILSDLLQQYPDDKELAQIWTKCVVPLVLDQEGKLQDCVLKVMRLLIMDNLTEYSQQQDDIWHALPWQLLTHIMQFNLHVCFMKACEVWVKEREIRSSLVKDLCTHVGTENNLSAWIVLYCLSSQMDFKNPMFAVEYYQQTVSSNEGSASLLVIVLEVLLSCCGYLPRYVQKDMLNELVSSLCNFSVQQELIRLNVEIAVELTHHLADSKKAARKKVKSWTGDLLQRSQMYLEDTFQPDATKALNGGQFLRHLHSLGEVAMYNPKRVSEKTFQQLQRFLFMADANGMGDLATDPVARALAVVSVGKLCVLNQIWANQSTRPLVKLLKSSQDLPTVMNIMYVLRDLCVRFGAIMEPHLPSLWLCLKDAAVEVRLTALTCLVELLQGNYIKFRGAMFFHLLSMLCDSDENMVELATYFLRDCLVVTNKNIMFEHFIDAFFHYNGYKGHEVYGKCLMSKEERENFLMKGDQFKDNREHLYGFMLENMDDNHRLQSRNNLVMIVLDGVSEGKVRLNEDGENVVLDALHMLNSKQINLTSLQQEKEDDPAADNVDKVTNVLVTARNKAIGECMKKNMIENIIPVVIHLKTVLQEKYSRLVPHLMLYVRDMMKDYKNEVKEIFAEDRQMAVEILHDIRELEKQEKPHENVQRKENVVSSRTSEHIPSRITAMLQSSSPWIRQSLGPEISRCYRVGGDELMLSYARAKLHQFRNQTQRRSGRSKRVSHSVGEGSEDFIQEPKQEGTSENDDVEARELEYGMGEYLAEEEFEVRDTMEEEFGGGDTVEEELEGRETVEEGFEDRESVEAECLMRETAEEEFEVGDTGGEGLEVGETLETGVGERETEEVQFEMREIVGSELEVREDLEEDNVARGALEEKDEIGRALGKVLVEGVRNAEMFMKETVSQDKNKQYSKRRYDTEAPSTSNVTPKTRRIVHTVSNPIVPGELNVFSPNISAIDNETVCFRTQESR